jgi:hypothetical protein
MAACEMHTHTDAGEMFILFKSLLSQYTHKLQPTSTQCYHKH